MKKEKTTADIDKWFNGEIQRQLDAIPQAIISTAKGNKEYIKVIAQSIATKCCFNEKAIIKSLNTLLK